MKIRTMNSVYELNDQGLLHNGELKIPKDKIEVVGFTDKLLFYYEPEDLVDEPAIDRMLYVQHEDGGYLRTSLIKEIIEQ